MEDKTQVKEPVLGLAILLLLTSAAMPGLKMLSTQPE